jgi:hypothetical protein
VKNLRLENGELSYTIRDAFPVTLLHTLIIPKRLVSSYFQLGKPTAYSANDCRKRLYGRLKRMVELLSSNAIVVPRQTKVTWPLRRAHNASVESIGFRRNLAISPLG